MDFPFPLLSDADEKLCAQFGVIKMKNMYGKKVRGIERSTFLIDGEGKLVQEWRGVKVPGHAAEVLRRSSRRCDAGSGVVGAIRDRGRTERSAANAPVARFRTTTRCVRARAIARRASTSRLCSRGRGR